jgi:hypothetical protein
MDLKNCSERKKSGNKISYFVLNPMFHGTLDTFAKLKILDITVYNRLKSLFSFCSKL